MALFSKRENVFHPSNGVEETVGHVGRRLGSGEIFLAEKRIHEKIVHRARTGKHIYNRAIEVSDFFLCFFGERQVAGEVAKNTREYEPLVAVEIFLCVRRFHCWRSVPTVDQKKRADMRRLRLPERLQKGDRVQLIAPASSFSKRAFSFSKRWLASRGYEVIFDPTVFEKDQYLAGSDRRRVQEFLHAWGDPGVNGIFCARGGYGAMRFFLEENRLPKPSHPKVLMGMSDITVLLSYIAKKHRLATVHGPVMAGTLFEQLSERNTTAGP